MNINSKLVIAVFLVTIPLSSSSFAKESKTKYVEPMPNVPYCAAIRGNGELIPAHWPAMAKIVENVGFPQAVAGGSSAVVSMFFFDAIRRNHNYSHYRPMERLQQSLLIKTIMPHINYLILEDSKAPRAMRLYKNVMELGDGGFVKKVKAAIMIAYDLPSFLKALGDYGALLNPEIVAGLKKEGKFEFYKQEILDGIAVFAKFDATDPKLFYRAGLVDFKHLARLSGRIADFYAANVSEDTNVLLKKFMFQCAAEAQGKPWVDISKKCKKDFKDVLDSYYEQGGGEREFANGMLFAGVGNRLPVFATTTLVKGEAATKYTQLLKNYEEKEGKGVPQFTLDFDTQLAYGYWGKREHLDNIGQRLKTLFPGDVKSSKFEALYEGNWFEVLSTSPAEPGLSNLQRIPDSTTLDPMAVINKKFFEGNWFTRMIKGFQAITWYNEDNPEDSVIPFRDNVYSAGGWSDLHPTLVLRAHGCEKVVYLTRQNGESVFGQKVFIQLIGETNKIPFWKNIEDRNKTGWANLTQDANDSVWNKSSNLATYDSSFNRSIGEADVVYCTNWDASENSSLDFKNGGVHKLLADSWGAPVFVKKESDKDRFEFNSDFSDPVGMGFPGCIRRKNGEPMDKMP